MCSFEVPLEVIFSCYWGRTMGCYNVIVKIFIITVNCLAPVGS